MLGATLRGVSVGAGHVPCVSPPPPPPPRFWPGQTCSSALWPRQRLRCSVQQEGVLQVGGALFASSKRLPKPLVAGVVLTPSKPWMSEEGGLKSPLPASICWLYTTELTHQETIWGFSERWTLFCMDKDNHFTAPIPLRDTHAWSILLFGSWDGGMPAAHGAIVQWERKLHRHSAGLLWFLFGNRPQIGDPTNGGFPFVFLSNVPTQGTLKKDPKQIFFPGADFSCFGRMRSPRPRRSSPRTRRQVCCFSTQQLLLVSPNGSNIWIPSKNNTPTRAARCRTPGWLGIGGIRRSTWPLSRCDR